MSDHPVSDHPVTVRLVVGLVTMALVSATAGRWWAASLAPLVLVWAGAARRRAVAPVAEQGPRDVPIELRRLVLERDGGACRYCHRPVHYECVEGCDLDFEADHVVAYSRGGPTARTNVVTACRRCNREKSDREVLEWLAAAWFTLVA